MDAVRRQDQLARHEREMLEHFEVLRSAPVVKILMVTDGKGSFSPTQQFGLTQVIEELRSDPWWWVQFEVVTAHREEGTKWSTGAMHEGYNFAASGEAALANFDEVWLFGDLAAPDIGPDEVAALHDFMDRGGGVFATGDHESLGAAICANLPRVNQMRRWRAGGPAGTPPPAGTYARHDTLRAGPTPGYSNSDQSDDVPQQIRPTRYYDPFGYTRYSARWRPHTILCGRSGVLDLLPDHMHEGAVVAPTPDEVRARPDVWPGGIGPEVIAEADVIAHTTAGSGFVSAKRFGVIGAYDGHRVVGKVRPGRIVTDATWHHWFNVNLWGFDRSSAHYDKIRNYFWNVALWLAPRAKQRQMFNAALHGLAWVQPFNELGAEVSRAELGRLGADALGRRVSQCMVTEWTLKMVHEKVWVDLVDRPFPPEPDPEFVGLYSLREAVLGGALQAVMKELGNPEPPEKPLQPEEVDALATAGAKMGLQELVAAERKALRESERMLDLIEEAGDLL